VTVTLGTLTLAAGSRAEPCRLTASTAARSVQTAERIRAPAVLRLDRANVRFEDTIEVDCSYDTPALAAAGYAARRAAALAAPKATLTYTAGGAPVDIGQAIVESVELADFTGAGFTIRYKLLGE
jgi:hypothetical protein